MRITAFLILGTFAMLLSACGSAETNTNANGNLSNGTNGFTNINASNMPPGLSASPVAPSANTTPGIPPGNSVVNAIPKGTTPTPGIPDPKNANKIKPGATPTPGIPSPEEIKRMQQRSSNLNAPPPPPPGAGDGMMMKSRKPRTANSNNE